MKGGCRAGEVNERNPSLQEGGNFAVYGSSATSVFYFVFPGADLQAGKVTCELPLLSNLNRTGYTWHILLPKLDSTLLYGETGCPPVRPSQ